MIGEPIAWPDESGRLTEPVMARGVSETAPNAAVIVAHPDDETLWCGGFILTHLEYNWFIATLCRKSDPDRAPKFYRVLQVYTARGAMGDLDDGPEQEPLLQRDVRLKVLDLLPAVTYELILTHAPDGEYTRHRRHEEVSLAVRSLWSYGAIAAHELWVFAYQDHGQLNPEAIETAHQYTRLPDAIWQEKYRLITEVYGFDQDSWEACITPKDEAFWRFPSPRALEDWFNQRSTRK